MTRRAPRFDLRQAGRQILVVLGGLAALNLAFFFTMVQPAMRRHDELIDQRAPFEKLNERREVVEAHEGYLAAVRQATADLESLRGEILATRDERLVEVQQEIAALCDQFGIRLASVGSDSELLLDEGLDRYYMNVPLEGSYANLRKFLHAVESSAKFLVVERVSLTRGKEGGSELSLTISLATYFTAPEKLVQRQKALLRR